MLQNLLCKLLCVLCHFFCLTVLPYVCKLPHLVLYSLQSWLGFLPMNIVMAGVSLSLWQCVRHGCVLHVWLLQAGTVRHPPDPEL